MIVFSGLDCSGKSTQIEILSNKIKSENRKAFVFWSRGGYTQGMQKLKDLTRLILGKKLPKSGRSKEREQAIQRPVVRKVWLSLAIIDLIFFYGIYLRFKKLIGYKVICDRYILDTSIDFALNFPDEDTTKWILWKFLKFVAVKPDKHFVSLIPVDVSVIRSKQKYEPFPDSPEVLQKRLEAYQKGLDENNELIYIDGLWSIEKVSTKVNAAIAEKN